ncbi:MAG: Hsp20 family protein [Candidatus Eisenbacteria bacterium]|nr:Hsp20 family protein [Candidatus Eisenbacteria bacterium]
MTLVRWSPRRALPRTMDRDLTSWMSNWDRMFESLFPDQTSATDCDWCPSVDVREEKDHYIVEADLPGIDRKDVEVTFENDVLTISGERKGELEEKESRSHRRERFFGRFTRSLRFPGDANRDGIEANFKDGVLTVRVPKSEQAKVRKIEVK